MGSNITSQLRIAIQGIPGAFHEIAARSYFESAQIEIRPCPTFEQLISITEGNGEADIAIMAIENSIAGSLMNNYRLLQESSLSITGEVFLRIRHQLLTLPGESLASLREVHSHPMAIAQCKTFFSRHPHIRLIESQDTALSAQELSQYKIEGRGAIASKLAASNYDLHILASNIETNHQNYTRFLILEQLQSEPLEFNRVSLSFSVKHEVGSLLKVLSVFESFGANLTKIQSTPIVGQKWEYLFFADFTFRSGEVLPQLLEKIKRYTTSLRLLGKYQKGNYHES
ncbi:MAG: prephenate dehydratase [Saprospiraceae bacterium]|nr:prephenate dehydratase [Saprospiraceae bacterium]